MDPQAVKLLHVEDSVADRMLVAKLLGTLKDYTFNIVRAATEITAAAELGKGGFGLVFLDYRLPMGDGVSCLKKLRQIDPAVPIVVLSGQVTPAIGQQCLEAGADGYHSKQDLTAAILLAVIEKVLCRTSIRTGLLPFCKQYLESLGPQLRRSLDELAADARQGGLTPQELGLLFDGVCQELAKEGMTGVAKILRPVRLDLQQALEEKTSGK